MKIKTKPVLRGRFTEDNTIKVTFRNKEYSIDADELSHLELIDTLFVDPEERPRELLLVFKGTIHQTDNQDDSKKLKLVG